MLQSNKSNIYFNFKTNFFFIDTQHFNTFSVIKLLSQKMIFKVRQIFRYWNDPHDLRVPKCHKLLRLAHGIQTYGFKKFSLKFLMRSVLCFRSFLLKRFCIENWGIFWKTGCIISNLLLYKISEERNVSVLERFFWFGVSEKKIMLHLIQPG